MRGIWRGPELREGESSLDMARAREVREGENRGDGTARKRTE